MREIKKIIIHCSASTWGNAMEIDKWHKQKGWSGIGYHYVILNGRKDPSYGYQRKTDGKIEIGRDIEKTGAHCKGQNSDSIGICLIGNQHFSQKQFDGLSDLLNELKIKYNLTSSDIYGHYEFSEKPCPNMASDFIRRIC